MALEPDPTGRAAPDGLARLVDELLEEIQAVRQQWHELDALLARIEAGDEAEPAADAETPAEGREDDPVQLMAREMMRAGRSREETASYLTQTFGLDVDHSLLDRVFEEGEER